MSNNLDLSQIAATQLNKHVTANDQVAELDAALTEVAAIAVDDTNAATLSSAIFQRHVVFAIEEDTTPPDDAITITVPAIRRGLFVVRNNTAQPLTVEVSGQADPGPVLVAGEVVLLLCDGAAVRAPGSLEPPYDVMVFLPGTFDAGALLVQLTFVRDVAFPEHLAGSFGHANATATAEAVLKLLKNDVQVGTVTFAPDTAAPTFSVSGGLAMAAGDRLAITAPAPADGTLADVTLGFRGARA